MKTPLLSVVIPTSGRTTGLTEAVRSALVSGPADEVEVIVVPNGASESWREALLPYAQNDQVRCLPIARHHANAARNYGLSLARGELIRFLDDDDFYYSHPSISQVVSLMDSDADVCSGSVDLTDRDGAKISRWCQPKTLDLVEATLAPSRVTLPTAHVFRRKSIARCLWDENIEVRQDTVWMMEVCAARELSWLRVEPSVGVWVQHRESRVSHGHHPDRIARITAESILNLVIQLDQGGRLNSSRRVAAADGLWSCLQKGLMYDRSYWNGIAVRAKELAPKRFPPSRLYGNAIVRFLDPYLVESLLSPARHLYRALRRGS